MIDRLSILAHYCQARRNFTRWENRESLESWQDARVKRHLLRTLPRSKYYRELFEGLSPDNWREFPVSTKAPLMASFAHWNTAGVTLTEASSVAEAAERTRDFSRTIRGCAVGLSSGTSGSRGVFLVSPEERRRWAGTILARALRGTLGKDHRAAMFLRADSPLYQTVGSRRFSFSFFDLFSPFEEHWTRLMELRPTLLAAPPSVLVRLASRPETASLLAPPGILLSVADVLDDADRAIIESGFGCKAGQLYQATEGFLAATCPIGNLHWNEDAIVVQKEWIDPGRTRYFPVITDFRRTTQPVIRFRLDDVIVDANADRCSCGSIFGRLEKIEGRHDDVLYLPKVGETGTVMIFPDFVRRALILALPTGVEYSVTQTGIDSWTIETAISDFNPAITGEIGQLCRDLKAIPPILTYSNWSPTHPGSKRRRIRRAIPAP